MKAVRSFSLAINCLLIFVVIWRVRVDDRQVDIVAPEKYRLIAVPDTPTRVSSDNQTEVGESAADETMPLSIPGWLKVSTNVANSLIRIKAIRRGPLELSDDICEMLEIGDVEKNSLEEEMRSAFHRIIELEANRSKLQHNEENEVTEIRVLPFEVEAATVVETLWEKMDALLPKHKANLLRKSLLKTDYFGDLGKSFQVNIVAEENGTFSLLKITDEGEKRLFRSNSSQATQELVRDRYGHLIDVDRFFESGRDPK